VAINLPMERADEEDVAVQLVRVLVRGTMIRPVALPITDAPTVTKLEHRTTIVRSTKSGANGFRFILPYAFPRSPGQFGFQLAHNNVYPNPFTNDDFGFNQSRAGFQCRLSGQLQLYHSTQDGIALVADPEDPPRYGRFFNDLDGGGKTAMEFRPHDDISELLEGSQPASFRFRIELLGFETDPPGNLARDGVTGVWIPLVGEFAVWLISVEIDRRFRPIGKYYAEKALYDSFRITPNGPYQIHEEHFWSSWGVPITDFPIDWRLSDLRAFDSATGRWHELTHWTTGAQHDPGSPDNGWSVLREVGKLSTVIEAGLSDVVNVTGKHLFAGLVPMQRRLPTLDGPLLLPQTVQSLSGGGIITYEGPTWRPTAVTLPIAQQEYDRGFWLLTPGPGVGVNLRYTAPKDGKYTLVGDFARANTLQSQGDGVTVGVRTPRNQWQAAIGSNHVVDPDTPFTGTSNVNFSLSEWYLEKGQTIDFWVGTGTENNFSFDITAFQLTELSFEEYTEPPFIVRRLRRWWWSRRYR